MFSLLYSLLLSPFGSSVTRFSLAWLRASPQKPACFPAQASSFGHSLNGIEGHQTTGLGADAVLDSDGNPPRWNCAVGYVDLTISGAECTARSKRYSARLLSVTKVVEMSAQLARWLARSQVAYERCVPGAATDWWTPEHDEIFSLWSFASIELFPSDFFPNNGWSRENQRWEGAPYPWMPEAWRLQTAAVGFWLRWGAGPNFSSRFGRTRINRRASSSNSNTAILSCIPDQHSILGSAVSPRS